MTMSVVFINTLILLYEVYYTTYSYIVRKINISQFTRFLFIVIILMFRNLYYVYVWNIPIF